MQQFNALGRNIIPENEKERIEALRKYDLLYAPSEEALNNIAHIVAEDFDAPIALISLVDEEEVVFKGNHGLPSVDRTPRGISLCSLAILSPDPTVVENAATDPCLMANPLVQGSFGLRFYAGAPIVTADGYPLGSVCIVDTKERTFSEKEQKRLARYAAIVMHEMSLRRAFVEEKKALEAETALRQKLVTKEIVKAQEKERSEIGLELHDNVSQILTTVKLYNEMARDGMGDTRAIMEKSNRYLQECIDEIRSISRRLSAPTLGKINFTDSIKELVCSVNQTGKLEVVLAIEGLAGLEISRELHLGIYRILQEKINNIIKHAGATTASIMLKKEQDVILLRIHDNGKGFDARNQNASNGLNNMRLRIESLSGSIHIESAPGQGCTLSASIPLAQGEEQ